MKFFRALHTAALMSGLFCVTAGFSAQAQTWPSRPIVLVIAYPVGSTVDLVGRAFADFTSKELGQTVIVENRAGGGGVRK